MGPGCCQQARVCAQSREQGGSKETMSRGHRVSSLVPRYSELVDVSHVTSLGQFQAGRAPDAPTAAGQSRALEQGVLQTARRRASLCTSLSSTGFSVSDKNALLKKEAKSLGF